MQIAVQYSWFNCSDTCLLQVQSNQRFRSLRRDFPSRQDQRPIFFFPLNIILICCIYVSFLTRLSKISFLLVIGRPINEVFQISLQSQYYISRFRSNNGGRSLGLPGDQKAEAELFVVLPSTNGKFQAQNIMVVNAELGNEAQSSINSSTLFMIIHFNDLEFFR